MSAELLFKLIIRFAQIYLAWWQSHQVEPAIVVPAEAQPAADDVLATLAQHEQRLAALEALYQSELAPDASVTLTRQVME